MSQARSLVLGILTIRSSFVRDREERGEGAPDTVQWWIGPERTWRIRTFALDRDIHVTSFEARPSIARSLAQRVLERSYLPVLARQIELEFPDPSDALSNDAVLRAAGLAGTLEIVAIGFGFWSPDGQTYRTQSSPP